MKNIVICWSLSSVLLLNSCTTTLVSPTKKQDINSVLKTGKTYTFYKTDGTKEKFRVLKVEEERITGNNEEAKSFSVQKSDISQVKKANTLGTVLIVAGGLAAAVVVPAFIANKPVGQ